MYMRGNRALLSIFPKARYQARAPGARLSGLTDLQ